MHYKSHIRHLSTNANGSGDRKATQWVQKACSLVAWQRLSPASAPSTPGEGCIVECVDLRPSPPADARAIEAIVDWKSDVEVLPDRVAQYLEQLRTYRNETGAELALLVFMTQSRVVRA
jgi:hypothetical protein